MRRLTRRDLITGAGAAAIGAVTGTAAHGFLYERHRVALREETLRLAAWPEALSGLRIGLLTDLHRSATVSHELIAGGVRQVMARAPDVIVLGGDYVTSHDTRYAGAAAAALSGLSARYGVFAVLGNHDDERAVPAALEKAGVEVLRDAWTSRQIRGETVAIAGLRYWTRSQASIHRVLNGRSGTRIAIAHDPRRLEEAAASSVPLLLSGHTHGGQVVLPWLGAVAARRFPIVAGTATRGHTTIYVSRGVGTAYIPVRLNCPPEVAVLTLYPRESRRSGERGSASPAALDSQAPA